MKNGCRGDGDRRGEGWEMDVGEMEIEEEKVGIWKWEIGNWKLEIGNWK